jgi:hypothetical protein
MSITPNSLHNRDNEFGHDSLRDHVITSLYSHHLLKLYLYPSKEIMMQVDQTPFIKDLEKSFQHYGDGFFDDLFFKKN